MTIIYCRTVPVAGYLQTTDVEMHWMRERTYHTVCREQCIETDKHTTGATVIDYLESELDSWLVDGCSDLIGLSKFTCQRVDLTAKCPEKLNIENVEDNSAPRFKELFYETIVKFLVWCSKQ